MTTAPVLSINDELLDYARKKDLSIDGDNAYKRDLIDCIVGAMALGYQNANPPPTGHWLGQFWDIGQAEGRRAEKDAEQIQKLREELDRLLVVPDALDERRKFEEWRQNWNGNWPRPADPGEWEAWQARAMLAAAPAAPAPAAQEPVRDLVGALEYYASGDHLILADADAWDTCSGEPINFLHDAAGTASVEDGSLAKAALAKYRTAPPAAEQPDTVKVSSEQLKQVATNFFYWWHNQPGTNTADGFDEWLEQHGRALLAGGEA